MLNNQASVQTPNTEPTADGISHVGKAFVDALSGNVEGGRDPGLLITNNDVRRIRSYVNAGLELPVKLEEVRQLTAGLDSGIIGLGPHDILALHSSINKHAKSWTPIEADMKKVGSDLNVFSASLITTSQSMVELITSLDSYQERQVSDLTADDIEKLPPVEVKAGDKKKIAVLLTLITELKGYISDHSASTLRVKNGVSTFRNVLSEEIAPSLNVKINLAASLSTDEKMALLNSELTRLNERIDQKIAEYDEYSSYKWIGFWWGAIGGAISYSIYGPKATQVVKDKDALIEEKKVVEKKIEQLHSLMASMISFETRLQDIKVRVAGASSSISNLENLWILLDDLVGSSYKKMDQITNAMFLVSFVARLKIVIANWTDIQKQSISLLTAFSSVLEEPVT